MPTGAPAGRFGPLTAGAAPLSSTGVLGTIASVSRVLAPIAVLAALFLPSCLPSSEPPATTTSTAPSTTTTTEPISAEESLDAFSECMEGLGVPVGPIVEDALGVPRLADAIDGLDRSDPEVRAALTACSGVLAVSGGADLAQDPELRNAVVDDLQRFTDCMRSEGIAGFPDPVPGFTGVGDPFPEGQVPYGSLGFADAAATCVAVLEAVNEDG